jgi:hypothetical protein
VPPGICQLVQFGNTNVVEPFGAVQLKLSISRVTFSAPAPKPVAPGLKSLLLVSPQLSGVVSVSW